MQSFAQRGRFCVFPNFGFVIEPGHSSKSNRGRSLGAVLSARLQDCKTWRIKQNGDDGDGVQVPTYMRQQLAAGGHTSLPTAMNWDRNLLLSWFLFFKNDINIANIIFNLVPWKWYEMVIQLAMPITIDVSKANDIDNPSNSSHFSILQCQAPNGHEFSAHAQPPSCGQAGNLWFFTSFGVFEQILSKKSEHFSAQHSFVPIYDLWLLPWKAFLDMGAEHQKGWNGLNCLNLSQPDKSKESKNPVLFCCAACFNWHDQNT